MHFSNFLRLFFQNIFKIFCLKCFSHFFAKIIFIFNSFQNFFFRRFFPQKSLNGWLENVLIYAQPARIFLLFFFYFDGISFRTNFSILTRHFHNFIQILPGHWYVSLLCDRMVNQQLFRVNFITASLTFPACNLCKAIIYVIGTNKNVRCKFYGYSSSIQMSMAH